MLFLVIIIRGGGSAPSLSIKCAYAFMGACVCMFADVCVCVYGQ